MTNPIKEGRLISSDIQSYCLSNASLFNPPGGTAFSVRVFKDVACPPGRPIVSGIDSVTSWVGKYIDTFLQPLVRQMPLYVKDTKSDINLIGEV